MSGSLPLEKLRALREAASFVPYRGPKKVVVGADLRGWEPRTRDLGDLHLKNCDLRGARLAGADLRGANLSLSDLRGTDLREADLRGADLEGADFSGADLTGADLRDTFLSATKFLGPDGQARVTGMRWEGGRGLLEEQEAYLRQASGISPT